MFTHDYSFKGSHADKVKFLTSHKFDKEHVLFDRNIDVYLMAPIVGFLYNKKSMLDKSSTSETKIFAEVMIKNQSELMFVYRLVMLLDKEYEVDIEKRINKVFREYIKEDPNDLEEYDSFVRGGVDVLYEKLSKDAIKEEDYIRNLYDFMEEIKERYSQNSDEIIDLCKLAKQ